MGVFKRVFGARLCLLVEPVELLKNTKIDQEATNWSLFFRGKKIVKIIRDMVSQQVVEKKKI